MKTLLLKSFILPFYRAHIGFFLLLLIFFGVFIRAYEHILLARFIIQNPYGIAAIILVFCLYSFFQTRFQLSLLNQKDYLVFHQMGLLKFAKFHKHQFYIWTGTQQLVIFYTLFLSFQSYLLGLWHIIALLFFILILLYALSSCFIYRKLKNTYPDQKSARLSLAWNKTFKLKYQFWFLTHLLQIRPLLLLGVKAFSLLMLNIFFSSYYSQNYDLRWLQFGIVCTSLINYLIWQEKYVFERKYLSCFLNTPSSIRVKITNHLIIFVQILLPEILFVSFQLFMLESILDAFSLMFLLIGLNAGLYSLHFHTHNERRVARNLFISFFMLLFIILFGVPPLLITLLCGFSFFYIFRSQYTL